jgi:ribosomal protein L28
MSGNERVLSTVWGVGWWCSLLPKRVMSRTGGRSMELWLSCRMLREMALNRI